MSEKRLLEAMEEMVHKLPPVNKKRKRKETKLPPPTSTVDQEDALANQLDDLITTDPHTIDPQLKPFTTDDKKSTIWMLAPSTNVI